MSDSPLLTNAVHISWEELKKISQNFKKAAPTAPSLGEFPSSKPKLDAFVPPEPIPNFKSPDYRSENPAASQPNPLGQTSASTPLSEEMLLKLYPLIRQRVSEEVEFIVEMTLKNTEIKLRKELDSKIDMIVAQALISYKDGKL